MRMHDELVLDVHAKKLKKVEAQVVALVTDAAKLRVPPKVAIGSGKN